MKVKMTYKLNVHYKNYFLLIFYLVLRHLANEMASLSPNNNQFSNRSGKFNFWGATFNRK